MRGTKSGTLKQQGICKIASSETWIQRLWWHWVPLWSRLAYFIHCKGFVIRGLDFQDEGTSQPWESSSSVKVWQLQNWLKSTGSLRRGAQRDAQTGFLFMEQDFQPLKYKHNFFLARPEIWLAFQNEAARFRGPFALEWVFSVLVLFTWRSLLRAPPCHVLHLGSEDSFPHLSCVGDSVWERD